MSFYLLFLCGVLGGILGGMGMGGGTLTIPLLTLLCGLEQGVAQGANLLSFLPMSLVALSVHAKNGLLSAKGLLWIVLPALLFSALGAFFAARLPAPLLRKAFGFFLIGLSAFPFSSLRKKRGNAGKNS